MKHVNLDTLAELRKKLDLADGYAHNFSSCAKVQVGSVLVNADGTKMILGTNHGVCDCKKKGCRRIKLYGENTKEHRLPSDCDSIHSEVDVIAQAAKMGIKTQNGTLYVTRYPCEACARAIGAAGIKEVIYGREEDISDYTKKIFRYYGVTVHHIDTKYWDRPDNNT